MARHAHTPSHDDAPSTRPRWRRPVAVEDPAAAAVAAAVAIVGVAAAQTGSTTDVTFVSLATPYKVLNGASIAANKTGFRRS